MKGEFIRKIIMNLYDFNDMTFKFVNPRMDKSIRKNKPTYYVTIVLTVTIKISSARQWRCRIQIAWFDQHTHQRTGYCARYWRYTPVSSAGGTFIKIDCGASINFKVWNNLVYSYSIKLEVSNKSHRSVKRANYNGKL